ncbi:hypothetical protein B0I35DRAFT_515620 [Stachybotrys elegans]|uniref:Uncharacterized protein n=1 Tax=Stachybotrys elegans TaxID=80388 RepID=A0A8K0SHR7_9HYPO|nr:hypothetical protein B0I35DRAFT_515620 [Stachybotrys elegans]
MAPEACTCSHARSIVLGIDFGVNATKISRLKRHSCGKHGDRTDTSLIKVMDSVLYHDFGSENFVFCHKPDGVGVPFHCFKMMLMDQTRFDHDNMGRELKAYMKALDANTKTSMTGSDIVAVFLKEVWSIAARKYIPKAFLGLSEKAQVYFTNPACWNASGETSSAPILPRRSKLLREAKPSTTEDPSGTASVDSLKGCDLSPKMTPMKVAVNHRMASPTSSQIA